MADAVGGLTAGVKDGKFVDYVSTGETEKNKKTPSGGNMDKDAFLKLLVAQMKYQDPLEPASNTEYISQYATFSELEQMQNMSSSLELARASGFVGQTVVVRTENSSGEIQEIEGKVDYVIYENNKAMLSINGEMYPASDVYATIDVEYQSATELATAFIEAMEKLPKIDSIGLSDAEVIYNLMDGFNAMTTYQQKHIPTELIEELQKYVTKMDELNATDLAATFTKDLDSLPDLDSLTLDNEEAVTKLQEAFNGMTAYQQGYLTKEQIEKLKGYVDRIGELKGAAEG